MCYFTSIMTQLVAHYVYVHFLPAYPGVKTMIKKFPISDISAFLRDYWEFGFQNYPPAVKRNCTKVIEDSVNITIEIDRKNCKCKNNNPPRNSSCVKKIRTGECGKKPQKIFNDIKNIAERYRSEPFTPLRVTLPDSDNPVVPESAAPAPVIEKSPLLNFSKAEPDTEEFKLPTVPKMKCDELPEDEITEESNEDIWPTRARLGGIAAITNQNIVKFRDAENNPAIGYKRDVSVRSR